mmetsp:Transcript_15423/g.30329  ORF Transcript_15423/g.30329 Transcript_15423/m.30329 type:complete len:144 (+) Transcript_15423:32-463(+)|eukprot:CAMPEP_0175146472 /NCGR_PEP_ID=MMETSP0087-20121206/15400_1 /TAXON_ID=136419 /ORGANISM="Unknown Unknown, Strain D1" /LENGTH=143 /DNA_ID=CAMNT_0016431443 /DNA_START=32 /DNA_END=463 /DNA_ORIENTATION=-
MPQGKGLGKASFGKARGSKKKALKAAQQKPYQKHTQTKRAPKAAKVNSFKKKHDKKITAAIGKNIEQIMAARVAHSGNYLKVIPKPRVEDMDALLSGSKGVKHGRKAAFDLTKSGMNQKRRDQRTALLEEVQKQEAKKANNAE